MSLSSHINVLATFLNLVETKFDITCITESRLSQKKSTHKQHQYPWI